MKEDQKAWAEDERSRHIFGINKTWDTAGIYSQPWFNERKNNQHIWWGIASQSQIISQQGKLVQETLNMIWKIQLLMYLLQFQERLVRSRAGKKQWIVFCSSRCFSLQIITFECVWGISPRWSNVLLYGIYIYYMSKVGHVFRIVYKYSISHRHILDTHHIISLEDLQVVQVLWRIQSKNMDFKWAEFRNPHE